MRTHSAPPGSAASRGSTVGSSANATSAETRLSSAGSRSSSNALASRRACGQRGRIAGATCPTCEPMRARRRLWNASPSGSATSAEPYQLTSTTRASTPATAGRCAGPPDCRWHAGPDRRPRPGRLGPRMPPQAPRLARTGRGRCPRASPRRRAAGRKDRRSGADHPGSDDVDPLPRRRRARPIRR